eukprot:scaffold50408_cov28-Tisochrysis_lutea.AAC.3
MAASKENGDDGVHNLEPPVNASSELCSETKASGQAARDLLLDLDCGVERLGRNSGERQVVLLVDLADGRRVRAPRGEHGRLLLLAVLLLEPLAGSLNTTLLAHAVHLVADNPAPV